MARALLKASKLSALGIIRFRLSLIDNNWKSRAVFLLKRVTDSQAWTIATLSKRDFREVWEFINVSITIDRVDRSLSVNFAGLSLRNRKENLKNLFESKLRGRIVEIDRRDQSATLVFQEGKSVFEAVKKTLFDKRKGHKHWKQFVREAIKSNAVLRGIVKLSDGSKIQVEDVRTNMSCLDAAQILFNDTGVLVDRELLLLERFRSFDRTVGAEVVRYWMTLEKAGEFPKDIIFHCPPYILSVLMEIYNKQQKKN